MSQKGRSEERPAGCNVCDRLAAEFGEVLMRKQERGELRQSPPEGVQDSAEDEQLEAELRSAKQHLMDHRRLIHSAP